MTKNKIHLDQDAIMRAVQPQIDKLQQEFTTQLQAIVREVRDEMNGQPAAEVYAVLMTRLRAGLPAETTLDEAKIRELADEIEAGTLTG